MSKPTLNWKTGFEIEVLAPISFSRRDLAESYARAAGGTCAPAFHPQAEVSLVEDAPVFENLTLAYDAFDADGNLIARCADDPTLQHDLDASAPPKPGWMRIVGDDPRFVRLAARYCDPASPLENVLEPYAKVFGTELERFDNGMSRLADNHRAPIVMAAPLPGERERPCEIITPPIETDHLVRLEALLAPARDLGFTIPTEAALHIHFDGKPLQSARFIANMWAFIKEHGESLKARLGTNPNCRRLGGYPPAFVETVEHPGFADLDWPTAQNLLTETGLTKYADYNFFNLVHEPPGKITFEVRVLPVSLKASEIVEAAALFETVIRAASENRQIPTEIW